MSSRIAKLIMFVMIFKEIVAQIEFPERFEIDKKKSNLAGRLPLYAPSRCKHDELLYPGDQVNDWICDCAPAALYYPESDACYPAFRQGPCAAEHILVLRPKSVIPECIPNVCKTDGQVLIHSICYELGKSAPCRNAHLSYVLGVDPATLLIDCVRLSVSLASRFGEDDKPKIEFDFENIERCARGTKRSQNGTCPTN